MRLRQVRKRRAKAENSFPPPRGTIVLTRGSPTTRPGPATAFPVCRESTPAVRVMAAVPRPRPITAAGQRRRLLTTETMAVPRRLPPITVSLRLLRHPMAAIRRAAPVTAFRACRVSTRTVRAVMTAVVQLRPPTIANKHPQAAVTLRTHRPITASRHLHQPAEATRRMRRPTTVSPRPRPQAAVTPQTRRPTIASPHPRPRAAVTLRTHLPITASQHLRRLTAAT